MPPCHRGEVMVSFIVPALNAETTLALCLGAILAARTDGGQKEVLVIDNGSADRTVDVARRHGARVVAAPGVTVAALRNLGARLARGEILAFVDADCVVAADWLERALPHFADPVVGAVGSATQIPAGATWVQHAWAVHRHRRNFRGRVEWLPTENLLVRRRAFEEVGGFNEDLVTCEDVDFCYRLGARHHVVNDPDVRSTHLGEAPTLVRFYKKEAWRGRGNLAGFFSHRLRVAELPSVLLPVYHVGGALALLGTLGYWLGGGNVLPALLSGLMLPVPSLLLALSTAVRARRMRWWPKLAALYVTYAAARAVAICADGWPLRSPTRPGAQPRR